MKQKTSISLPDPGAVSCPWGGGRELDDQPQAAAADREPGRLSHWFRLAALLSRYGRAHSRAFTVATVAAMIVVGLRLALPWTLKAALKPWLSRGPGKGEHSTVADLNLWSPATAMVAVFFVLVLCLGFFDLVQRLNYARFSIGTVRDLRAAAFKSALEGGGSLDRLRTGDLIARLVGDTTRIKAGMKGFFVHVTTNGILYVGATGMLLWMNPLLGAVFALAGSLLLLITYRGAVRMYDQAARYRTKEGMLADSIHRAWNDDPGEGMFSKINTVSGTQEAALTRIQGTATWLAYVVFGASVLVAFGVGISTPLGRLDRGQMVVFVLYAMTLRAPVVQLVRQGTRTGKILACVQRLHQILDEGPANAPQARPPEPLRDRIRLGSVRVRSGKSQGRRRRLGPIDLEIPAGQHIAIVGRTGAGKTTLLRVLAGLERARNGTVFWDNIPSPLGPALAATPGVLRYAPQQPGWHRAAVRALLGLGETGPSDEQSAVISACRADRVISRLPGGLDARVGPHDLSPGEGRSLSMCRVLLSGASVLLLDDPVCSLSVRSGSRAILEMIRVARGRTLLVTFTRGIELQSFDRVIELKKGRIVFDGPPALWGGSGAEDGVGVLVSGGGAVEPEEQL